MAAGRGMAGSPRGSGLCKECGEYSGPEGDGSRGERREGGQDVQKLAGQGMGFLGTSLCPDIRLQQGLYLKEG